MHTDLHADLLSLVRRRHPHVYGERLPRAFPRPCSLFRQPACDTTLVSTLHVEFINKIISGVRWCTPNLHVQGNFQHPTTLQWRLSSLHRATTEMINTMYIFHTRLYMANRLGRSQTYDTTFRSAIKRKSTNLVVSIQWWVSAESPGGALVRPQREHWICEPKVSIEKGLG